MQNVYITVICLQLVRVGLILILIQDSDFPANGQRKGEPEKIDNVNTKQRSDVLNSIQTVK